jgi:hypothetical protein
MLKYKCIMSNLSSTAKCDQIFLSYICKARAKHDEHLFNKLASVSSKIAEKSSCYAAALSVTKFKVMIAMTLVTLCHAS